MIKLNLASRPGLCEEGKLPPLFLKDNFYKEEVIGAAAEGESVLKVGKAEKEEFVPKHTSLPPKKVKKGEPVVEKKRSFAPFLYFMLVIIVVGGGYWLYKTKLSPITSFSVTKGCKYALFKSPYILIPRKLSFEAYFKSTLIVES